MRVGHQTGIYPTRSTGLKGGWCYRKNTMTIKNIRKLERGLLWEREWLMQKSCGREDVRGPKCQMRWFQIWERAGLIGQWRGFDLILSITVGLSFRQGMYSSVFFLKKNCFCLETWSYYVALTDLELVSEVNLETVIFLPQTPACWDYKCMPPHRVLTYIFE